jgi:hypothetical protein
MQKRAFEEKEWIAVMSGRTQIKPLKVLSTSLGLLLAGHLILAPTLQAAQPDAAAKPQLVEWSTEAVKAYFDPNIDWSIPFEQAAQQTPAPGTGGGSAPIIINNGGFGWDDLLLYHMIFNMGSPYSSKKWSSSRPSYDVRTNKAYVPKTYTADTFRNKPSVNKPSTSSGTGSFKTNSSSSTSNSSSTSSKTTTSSKGSIGSKSSGFSSSSSGG